MTNVLFIGDIHIKHKNVSELEILIDRFSKPFDKIDFIVLAGDVLDAHEKVDSQLMNIAYRLIRTLRDIAKTFVLVGNHDYINNQQFLTDNHWMNGLKEWVDVVVVDKPLKENNFIFVPYVFPGRFKEALSLVDDWKTATCIFAHQEFKGSKMGAIISIDGDEWTETDPLVVSGHIHERQFPRPNIYYPGSVINHAFGNDSQGMYLLSFTKDLNNKVTFEESRIDLGFEKKKTIYLQIGSFSEGVSIPKSTIIPSNRFNLLGTNAEISEFKHSKMYKCLKEKNVKVVFSLIDEATAPKYLLKRNRCSFRSVLEKLIKEEKDEELEKDYKEIFDQIL